MTDLAQAFQSPPYGLAQNEKTAWLTAQLVALTAHHQANCPAYANILAAMNCRLVAVKHYSDLPFLPTSLFKTLELRSVPEDAVYKTVLSSGTSGQAPSRIFLDRATAALQQKVLARIVTSFMGAKRLPLLIIDSPALLQNRQMFSVRGAGVLGFSIFGSERVYALTEDMQLDVAAVMDFAQRHRGERVMLFGFTFMVWQLFCKELQRLGHKPDFANAVLIHGGGLEEIGQPRHQPGGICPKSA